jgi:hypothetical protein
MVIEWILDRKEADAATFRREQAVPAERWPTMEDVGEQIMRELGKSQLAGSSPRSYSPHPCAWMGLAGDLCGHRGLLRGLE